MKKFYKKRVGLLLLIISIFILFRFIGIEHYINFQILKEKREFLLSITAKFYWLSVVIYIASYIFVASLSLPIAGPLTMIGGFIFGVFPAVLYTNVGATLGSVLIFLLVRNFIGSELQKTYSNKLSQFNRNIDRYGANYLLIARLIPLIPFFLVNILSGLTSIPLKTFIWTTFLGIIPGSIVYAYVGKNIINIDSPKEIFSTKILVIFALLILFSLGSILIKRMRIFKSKACRCKDMI